MDAKTPSKQTFSKVLRSFQAGRIGLDELLAHIDQELASGSAPSDIRGILHLSEFIEPLPDAVLEAVKQRLNHRPRTPKPEGASAEIAEPPPGEELLHDGTEPQRTPEDRTAIQEAMAPGSAAVDASNPASEPVTSMTVASTPVTSTSIASTPVAMPPAAAHPVAPNPTVPPDTPAPTGADQALTAESTPAVTPPDDVAAIPTSAESTAPTAPPGDIAAIPTNVKSTATTAPPDDIAAIPMSAESMAPAAQPDIDATIPVDAASVAAAPSPAAAAANENPPLRVPAIPTTVSPMLSTGQAPIKAGKGAPTSDATPIPVLAQPVELGTTLSGRYRLIHLISKSPSSDIYKAMDSRQPDSKHGEVAVKVMSRPFVESDATFTALQRYVRALASLKHPNIVRIFDCERDAANVFMTMEYLPGESLAAIFERAATVKTPTSALDAATARMLISAVANALDFAHQNSVVHGRLAPDKVILAAGQERVTLIGFEIPGWLAQPKTALERREAAGERIVSAVTPRYSSPQLMARQRPDVTDDVYALACLAYRTLTGWHPFDDGTGSQTLRFPPPNRPGISSGEYAAVVRALAFERSNRTVSVRQFITEFDAADDPVPRKGRLAWGGAAAILVVAVVAGLYLHSRSEITPLVHGNVVVAPRTPEPPVVSTVPRPKPGSIIRDCPTCLPMTVLPGGRFEQGATNADTGAKAFERPRHSVIIAYEFAMSTDDVTVGDFQRFAAASGRQFRGCDTYDGQWKPHTEASWQNPGFEQTAQHPVTCVSWNDAVAYAQWLSTGSGHRYRLPSASEWEYAARAGAAGPTPWGPDSAAACESANVADASAAKRYPGWAVFSCDDGIVNTAKVGSYKPNAFGLNDMLGNVFVWTADCWHGDYTGAPADGSARVDTACSDRELRGGSWFSSPVYVNPSYRNHFAADYRTSSVGFRLVREID